MRLSEAVRDFGDYARHEAGHTTATYHSYICALRAFLKWLDSNGFADPPVREVTVQQVRRYSYSLSGRGLRPRTIRGNMHALRALFDYLVKMGALDGNPAREVQLPKVDAAQRLLVADEDLQRLLEATERQASDFRCIRDKALLAVLIFCGLRRQELLDLNVSAVNLAEGAVLVQQGKGRKSRTVYLCQEAAAALRDWLAMRGTLNCRHEWLFLTEARQRVGENTLAHVVEEIKAIAGLKGDPRIKPHSIRHAAATRLLRNGADIRSIQNWLGHSQLQTTAVYLHADEEQSRKIAPLSGFKPKAAEAMQPSADKPAAYFRKRRSSR